VLGLLPNHLLLPALPETVSWWSELETDPIIAKHSVRIILDSPEGSFTIAYLPSLDVNCAEEPALLAITAPCPGLSSIQEITVPKGIFFSFIALPTLGSAVSEEITFWSTLIPLGAMIYLFSPSAYSNRAMKAVLFGSYSTVFTVASTSNLFLLKSMILYFFLCPPPV